MPFSTNRRPAPVAAAPALQTVVRAAGTMMIAIAATFAVSTLTPALAQTLPEASVASGKVARLRYDIPAGTVEQVLTAFAKTSGLLIAYTPALVEGRRSKGLQGEYAVEDALLTLLLGSDLAAVQTGEGRYTLREVPRIESWGTTMLPAVKVMDTAEDGSAAEGYRVAASSVAGFSSQSIQETPRSVRVISAELIANQLIKDIDGLARLDASVTSAYRPPGFHARAEIRGFDVADGQNYRYNGLAFLRQQQTPLENKERVEILKGLAALQAGFTSPGGIINYVTKRPDADAINDGHFSFDQFGSSLAHADVSRRSADGKLGLRVNAAVESLRSYVEEAQGDRQFVSVAGDWKIAGNTLLQADLEYQKRDQIEQPSFRSNVNGKIPRNFDPTTFLGQKWARYKTENITASGHAEHYFSDTWAVIVDGNYNRTKHPFISIDISQIQENGDGVASLYRSEGTDREVFSLRPTVQGRIRTGAIQHDLELGASLQKFDAMNGGFFYGQIGMTNIFNPVVLDDPMPVIDGSKAGSSIDEVGVFVNDVVTLTDAWQLHLGGRYADFEQRAYNAIGDEASRYAKQVFAPNLAVVFKASERFVGYVNYAEGLENGGVAPQQSNGMPVTNAGEVKPPLASRQYEIGMKAEFGPRLSGDFALFQIERPSNFIDSSNTFVQKGEQVNRGIELSLTGRITNAWTLFGSALWLDAELDETGDPTTQGKRPTSVPRQRTAITAEFAPPSLQGWTFSGNWSHTGSRPLDDTNTLEFASAFDVFTLGGRYTTTLSGPNPHPKRITLRGAVENLFDERYYATSNFNQLIAGPPRTISLTAELNF